MSLHEIEHAGLFWITLDGAIKWWGSVARQLRKKENCISRNLKRKQKQKQKQKLKNQKKSLVLFCKLPEFSSFFFFFHLILFACLFVCCCFFDSTSIPTPYKALWKQKTNKQTKRIKLTLG